MARDAIPQHEISLIVRQLSQGATLEEAQKANPTVSKEWFRVNADSLLVLAGKAEKPKKVEPAPAGKAEKPK